MGEEILKKVYSLRQKQKLQWVKKKCWQNWDLSTIEHNGISFEHQPKYDHLNITIPLYDIFVM